MATMPVRGGLEGLSPLASIEDLGAEASRQHRDFGAGSLIVCDRLVRIYIAAGIEVQALQGLDLLVAEGRLGVALDEPVEDARTALELAVAEASAADPWLRELTASAVAAPIPILLGGHTLVGPGVRLVVSGPPRGARWT